MFPKKWGIIFSAEYLYVGIFNFSSNLLLLKKYFSVNQSCWGIYLHCLTIWLRAWREHFFFNFYEKQILTKKLKSLTKINFPKKIIWKLKKCSRKSSKFSPAVNWKTMYTIVHYFYYLTNIPVQISSLALVYNVTQ